MGSIEWTVVGTGLGILAVNVGLFAWLRGDLGKLADRVNDIADQLRQLGERTAKVEGLLEGRRPTPNVGD